MEPRDDGVPADGLSRCQEQAPDACPNKFAHSVSLFPGVPSEGLPSGVFSASAARPAASVAGGSASSEGRPFIGSAPAGGYSMRKT